MATSVCMTLQSYFTVFFGDYVVYLVHCIPDLLLLIENLRKLDEWKRIGGICFKNKSSKLNF